MGRNGFRLKEDKVFAMDSKTEQVAMGIQLNRKLRASRKFMEELELLSKALPAGHPVLQGKKAWARYLNQG